MVVLLVGIDLAWVMLAAQAGRFFTTPRAMRVANRTSAGVIPGAATAIAAR
jgi:threonine/homoserine/homoserine lactone efflux protein